jgi:cell division protein FtsZ
MPDLDFDMPQNQSSSIKVIGVGGGGSNAVNYMYGKGIRGVDFVVCNTDQQALDDSPVPTKIQLGVSVTEGLGAGAWPLKGRMAAEENIQDVIDVLEYNTKMVFINAGMGGGTGTGAAPIIAKAAKDMDILTVAIVTIPFVFEGDLRMSQAKEGIEDLKKYVDSLIVINNNKLREIYGNLGFKSGFAKADEILATASRGIAEVITQKGHLNIDLNDAKTVLSNSGTAIMGSGTALGDGRAIKAVKAAIESPLLDNNHIRGAKKVLLLIVSGTEEVTFEEMGEISDFIQDQVTLEGGTAADIIMGVAEDEELDSAVNVTVVATGFHEGKSVNPLTGIPEKVVHDLEANSENKKSNISLDIQVDSQLDNQVTNILPPLEGSIDFHKEQIDSEEISQKEVCQDQIIKSKVDVGINIPDPRQSDIYSNEQIRSKSNEVFESCHDIQNIINEEDKDQKQVSMTFDLDPLLVDDEIPSKREEPKIVFNLIEEIENELIEKEDNHISSSESKLLDSNQDIAPSFSSDFKDSSPEENINEDPKPSNVYFSLDKDESDTESSSVDIFTEEGDIYSKDKLIEEVINNKTEQVTPLTLLEDELLDEIEVEKLDEIDESAPEENTEVVIEEKSKIESSFLHTLSSDNPILKEQIQRAQKRKERLQKFNYRFRNNSVIENAEREPAYKRQNVSLDSVIHSSQESMSRYTLETDDDGEMQIKDKNSFLHDNVD